MSRAFCNMDDDLIVVDDENESVHEPVNPHASSPSKTVPERSIGLRLRTSVAPSPLSMDNSERATRFCNTRSKPQPTVKLKLSDKAASQAPQTSFLGKYDRELDSDEEPLAFEEQFILRMAAGEDCEKLRKAITSREVGDDVWFKFKDSRRAVFHVGNSLYSAKLVDLPCIVESQKTVDNKHMFKVADISQMLVVGNKISSEDQVKRDKSFNIEEFIWPHGVTPPLRHARKRRFRKRVNRRTIESVEQEVERLLDEDSLATEVKYEILDNVNPDWSDSEFIEQEAPTPVISDMADAPTPRGDMGDGEDFEEPEENDDEESDGDIDEELAAELDLALGYDDVDEDEEDDDESEEEESEDEDDEDAEARKLLSEEIRDLEAAVTKKGNEIASSGNPLIRKRFEDALKKLTADLEMKSAQLDELKEKQRLKKEGITIDAAEDNDFDNVGHDDGEGDTEDDEDLFGDGPMDIG